MRIAGAQIPVGSNIQSNKIEILKSLDWAKQNAVDHLLTPEVAYLDTVMVGKIKMKN